MKERAMANDNETVEQVYDDLAEIGAHDRECPPLARVLTHHRFHGRKQIKEISDEDWYFGDVDPCVLLFVCDRFLAAHKRELAAKDEEIEKFKFDNMVLKSEQRAVGEVIIEQTNKVEAKDSEIMNLRAIVKELADALEPFSHVCCVGCVRYINHECTASENRCCSELKRKKLVAKAREVCK